MEDKITYQRAKELLENGKYVICKWGDHENQKDIVKTILDLDRCISLKKVGIRDAEFYEIQDPKIPNGCISIGFDKAYMTVHSREKKVFTIENGEEHEISSVNKLIELRRQKGEKMLLYTYE